MRVFAISAMLCALAACAAEVPDSGGRGVGFGDYSSYEAERIAREQALTGRTVPQTSAGPLLAPGQQTAALDPAQSSGAITSNELAAAGIGTGPDAEAVRDANDPVIVQGGNQVAPAAQQTTVQTTSVQPSENPGISDEQDFGAVTGRETIESDAARRAEQQAQYQVVQPTEVPERTTQGGPNIVQYALQTTHNPGQQVYSRFGFNSEARYARNCGQYASADIAQQDFLARGGPQSDRLGLDPDGDGFACGWDPRPFRAARGG